MASWRSDPAPPEPRADHPGRTAGASAAVADEAELGLLPPLVADRLEDRDVDRLPVAAAGWHGHAIALRVEDGVEHLHAGRELSRHDPGEERLVVDEGVDRAGLQRLQTVLRGRECAVADALAFEIAD